MLARSASAESSRRLDFARLCSRLLTFRFMARTSYKAWHSSHRQALYLQFSRMARKRNEHVPPKPYAMRSLQTSDLMDADSMRDCGWCRC